MSTIPSMFRRAPVGPLIVSAIVETIWNRRGQIAATARRAGAAVARPVSNLCRRRSS